MRREDIQNFVDVYAISYKGLEEYAYRTKRDIRNYFKWLFKRDKNGFFVAEIDAKAVGFVACDTNWFSLFEFKKVGEIHEIFVLPEYRKKRVASTLLTSALEYALKKGRDVAELWVGEKNSAAKLFYEKNGFRETEKIGKWVRMVKSLI